jgi:acyl carrier protein
LTANVFADVQGIASDLFGIPANQVTGQSSPESIEAWDSTQHLNLVLALEEKFGIALSPEEMEQMRNIGEVVRVVENKLQSVSR